MNPEEIKSFIDSLSSVCNILLGDGVKLSNHIEAAECPAEDRRKLFEMLVSDNGSLLFMEYGRMLSEKSGVKNVDAVKDLLKYLHTYFQPLIDENPRSIYCYEYISNFCF
jgi:hypothetical protein